ncbi:hypothetical protein AAG570_000789 [Ranatra chinensis]|uniref:Methylthioribose-1-phosphate isomerase n=1 Tax=Ranatra chinensis TaxID=642074 RepID=A0ABD0YY32_9HEMI
MTLQAIKYNKGKLEILDQLLLPTQSVYRDILSVEDGWKAINSMQVRGAPAIAIVGALSLAVEMYPKIYEDKQELEKDVEEKLNRLVKARPTAVNMKIATHQITSLAKELAYNDLINLEEMKAKILGSIEEMLEKDVSDNKSIGLIGADAIIKQKNCNNGSARILTHCNTGSLATAGYGTALGVIRALHESNHLEHVYCTETRPYMQGARLTAYELVHDRLPSTLVCDSAVAALLQHEQITAVVVGADRVAANGDTANKIGTYQIAVVAKHHGVPFYVASPLSSVDLSIPSGEHIPIEERSDKEITHVLDKRIAAPGISCWNPAFDITPASLITGIITEHGMLDPLELEEKVSKFKCLQKEIEITKI